LGNLNKFNKSQSTLKIDVSKDLERSVETRDPEYSKGARTVKGLNRSELSLMN
jgi:hypothetical protein